MRDNEYRRELHYSYEAEVKELWGDTAAYKEYKEKTKGYSKGYWAASNLGMMAIISEIADCMISGDEPGDAEVQALVKKLQEHITKYYYTCTDEILAGLGRAYVSDDRFKKNIDKHGEGTAEFLSNAIAIYCKEKLNG